MKTWTTSLVNKAELTALHDILARTEYLALSGTESKKIARLLDQAEYLVDLLMREPFNSSEYEGVLRSIGKASPVLSSIADDYVKSLAPE